MPDLFDYDAELRLHNERLRAGAQAGARDHVLDIGCGTGLSTREAARAAAAGSVLGVHQHRPRPAARRASGDAGLARARSQSVGHRDS